MTDRRRSILIVAFTAVLFSLVGILAKIIPHSAGTKCFGRAIFALAAFLVLYLVTRKKRAPIKREDWLSLIIVGLLNSANWYFFFLAVDCSTVAVAVLSLFTYPLMTCLIEPLVFREKSSWIEVGSSLAVLGGVFLLVERFDVSHPITLGVIYGLLSALSLSLRNIVSRKVVQQYDGVTILLIMSVIATLLFSPFVVREAAELSWRSLAWMFVLGAIVTTFSQLLFLNSLKVLTSRLASIIVSLQPVLAVSFAFLFLDEVPSGRTLVGGGIICASVMTTAVYHYRRSAVASESAC